VAAGAVVWAGQTVTIAQTGQATPVRGPTYKRSLVGVGVSSLALTVPVRASSLSGDDVDSEELVGAPRAVPIGAAQNSLQEV